MLLAATAWSNAATRCGATAFAVVHGAGTAHGLAVDRDHPAGRRRRGCGSTAFAPITRSNRSASNPAMARGIVDSRRRPRPVTPGGPWPVRTRPRSIPRSRRRTAPRSGPPPKPTAKDHRQQVAHPATVPRGQSPTRAAPTAAAGPAVARGQGWWAKMTSAGGFLGVVGCVRTSIQASVATPVTHATPLTTPQNRRSQPHSTTLPRPWVRSNVSRAMPYMTCEPISQATAAGGIFQGGGCRPVSGNVDP